MALAFLRRQTQRLDDRLNLAHRQTGHGGGRIGQREQLRRHFVHLFVRALGTEHDGDQQREGVAVVQRDCRRGIKLFQTAEDVLCPLALVHRIGSLPLSSSPEKVVQKKMSGTICASTGGPVLGKWFLTPFSGGLKFAVRRLSRKGDALVAGEDHRSTVSVPAGTAPLQPGASDLKSTV